jgi:transaldolase/glucose-6-phosphate isomerase
MKMTFGKEGKGLIPIDRGALGTPDIYGGDRIFIYLRLRSATDVAQDQSVEALERAGHRVVRVAVDHPYDLGEEFFRGEIATAVAGSIPRIHPFDQPDVEAGKIVTRKLTAEYEKSGILPPETPIFTGERIKLFTDGKNTATTLKKVLNGNQTLARYFKAQLRRLGMGDYFALLVWYRARYGASPAAQADGLRAEKHTSSCCTPGLRERHQRKYSCYVQRRGKSVRSARSCCH